MNKTDYMLANREIALFMADKSENGHYRTLCPVCLGGQSREESLSVSGNKEGYVFICFRAACGFKGRKGNMIEAGHGHREFVPRPFYGETVSGVCMFELFASITRLAAETSTKVFECRGLDGSLRGHVTRTKDKVIKTYRLSPVFYYSSGPKFFKTPNKRLWIVEDPTSAAALAYFGEMPAVALMGTNLSNGVRDEIVRYTDTVFVALDPGAEEAAVSVINSLLARGVQATFVPLQKDIKDLAPEEIRALVKVYTGV